MPRTLIANDNLLPSLRAIGECGKQLAFFKKREERTKEKTQAVRKGNTFKKAECYCEVGTTAAIYALQRTENR